MPAGAAPEAPAVPDRLYGRRRGHPLRQRQQLLLDQAVPRLGFDPADPWAGFPVRPQELWLEVGFGGGEHALAQIEAHPQAGLIAAEVFENGICSLLTRIVPDGEEATSALPPNLRLWTEDARRLLRALPESSLSRLFLMFPDPWPKARHAKRRFVHPSILPVLQRAIRPGGEWRIATDDPTYQAWVAEVMAAQDIFERVSLDHSRPEGWPPTRYEAKALREGRSPMYWIWRRK
ncbi:tRNA (guanine-N7)-methyltransferase [Pseudoroseomonas deserti]|uniref:tRNA (guanine-N(7)-)-methyltransferase n=1 Tax=Teichococcus deserti TaxID=1817963 RepID=A0A1V2H2L6_9PROT|nr:tRNA (guanine(46)-N(7))-methyltransferase TrmB [Pseudoroseomonas deserti]ONG53386.1 tRNA (guanine-N7)-methyltransferase [Pseudoroseomonas deserti]